MLYSEIKNKILIAGGGDISRFLSNSLSKNYEIITVSRSSGDFVGDLSDREFVADLVEKTGLVYGVICCVGGPHKNDNIYNLDNNFFDTIEDNLFAPINLTRFYFEKMKKVKKGCFIYMSSNLTSCIRTPKNYLGYTISKHSLEKMTDILSTNECKTGVRFNCVTLGFVRTEKYKKLMTNEEMIKNAGSLGGYVQENQIFNMVDFILKNKTITGMKARLDNGNHHE